MSRPEPAPVANELRADLAAIIAHALAERDRGRGALPDLLGLEPKALARLGARWLPCAALPDLDKPLAPVPQDQTDIALMIRWRGGAISEESFWLAQILARRAMEPRHLWEDLGLPDRPALGRLIAREFPKLHAANSRNMRWKRFFYRQICSDSGAAMCLSPNCDDCPEWPVCFGPETA
ncbi:nitrogen fixation protein NifQ [Paracoccaceae bacterium Fryx2]|nr:nitrogen fixation protein NifQ [Paracoccaceae bacterium Fryx2]